MDFLHRQSQQHTLFTQQEPFLVTFLLLIHIYITILTHIYLPHSQEPFLVTFLLLIHIYITFLTHTHLPHPLKASDTDVMVVFEDDAVVTVTNITASLEMELSPTNMTRCVTYLFCPASTSPHILIPS